MIRKFTMTSPTFPYSSHNTPNSNASPNISVWTRDQWTCCPPSRSREGAVHLVVA
jgi:hypothetical protein